ncbi:MAG: hypothetical protein QMD85_03450 [Candidatus Aenigmarchaeota archaeon]|nr:hypothetical protein [Candidatus Aenigmarchaeota archaeon]MDI6722599.1 hypothetical protein [Candidatus Aenigmarchaeota archaeon]
MTNREDVSAVYQLISKAGETGANAKQLQSYMPSYVDAEGIADHMVLFGVARIKGDKYIAAGGERELKEVKSVLC